jgi:hypothetical protein
VVLVIGRELALFALIVARLQVTPDQMRHLTQDPILRLALRADAGQLVTTLYRCPAALPRYRFCETNELGDHWGAEP